MEQILWFFFYFYFIFFQISEVGNARMSIGTFLTAVLLLTTSGKTQTERELIRSLENSLEYFTTTFSNEESNASLISSANVTDVETSTTTVEPTLFEFKFGNRSEGSRKQFDANGKLVTRNWPVKHSAEMNGDLILGGLMMVHEREDSVTCGPIMPQGGVQALETMLYTLDVINAMGILPNITMGAHILDDCDKDTYGLEMAVDFIKGKKIKRFQVFKLALLFFFFLN